MGSLSGLLGLRSPHREQIIWPLQVQKKELLPVSHRSHVEFVVMPSFLDFRGSDRLLVT